MSFFISLFFFKFVRKADQMGSSTSIKIVPHFDEKGFKDLEENPEQEHENYDGLCPHHQMDRISEIGMIKEKKSQEIN